VRFAQAANGATRLRAAVGWACTGLTPGDAPARVVRATAVLSSASLLVRSLPAPSLLLLLYHCTGGMVSWGFQVRPWRRQHPARRGALSKRQRVVITWLVVQHMEQLRFLAA
jgi:hypothetical protein